MYTHSNHIPQPPHSAGHSYQGLRAHIEPTQVPTPTDAIEADRQEWALRSFMTLPGQHVPLSTTDYVAIDQGNSSPKFVRVSAWNVPSNSKLAGECEIPLSAVFQPFVDLDVNEEPVPLVESGDAGPARCAKCRGYINPWCTWVSGGMKWKCNLCNHETEVSTEYFCNLDANLMRLDHSQRPELNKGTIDFAVSDEYWAVNPPPKIAPSYYTVDSPPPGSRKPQPMDYIFAFDVSNESVQSGFLATACSSLRKILFGGVGEDELPIEPCFPENSRISILSFDKSLHFYNLSSHFQQAPMMVLSDIEEIFLPLKDGLFTNPLQSRTVIENLLKALPQRHEGSQIKEAALGAALSAALAALAGRGGQVIAFQSTMPTVGPGALISALDEAKLSGTDEEKKLFMPRSKVWRNIGEECAEEGIGVSMFLGMSQFIDIGTIGSVASLTGGDLYFHPRFDPARDGFTLNSQMQRLMRRTTAYNCMMRVRCSNGLRITAHYGNFYQQSITDLEFGILDADKAVSISMEVSHSLDDREHAYLQSAVLYTTVTGQRRVRTCNLALQVASLAGSIFRFADMDTVVSLLAKEAISYMTVQPATHIREDLTEKCSALLLGYRRNCAAATRQSQLILPEAFRALPLYTLALIKCKPLKGRIVSADVRNYYAHRIRAMSVRCLIQHLYPRLLALHDLEGHMALPNPNTGQLEMPTLMRATHFYMEANGIYLIDNEEVMILWIGSSVSSQLLMDLFGVEFCMDINPNLSQLPVLPTLFSTQVRNILAHRRVQRGYSLKFYIARQNIDAAEIEFSDMLVEDQNNATLSYVDYLSVIHKQITHALDTGGYLPATSSLRGSPW